MTDRPLLSIDNLCALYRPGEPVLSGFSLKLEAGEAVALIGLNGAGKTTLIKAMAGLLQGVQMDGAAWRGRPLSFRDEGFKRERCVVLDQGAALGISPSGSTWPTRRRPTAWKSPRPRPWWRGFISRNIPAFC